MGLFSNFFGRLAGGTSFVDQVTAELAAGEVELAFLPARVQKDVLAMIYAAHGQGETDAKYVAAFIRLHLVAQKVI